MPGRHLCTDAHAIAQGYASVACARRRGFQATAGAASGLKVRVLAADWGEVALSMAVAHSACCAVLNMANAHVPGGAYVEGAASQEENLMRRTDTHFHLLDEHMDPSRSRYRPEMTALLSAASGRVYLDAVYPRVCLRGPEVGSRADLGYRWLESHELFPFFELRAAAQDLRDAQGFDAGQARRRIAAQLETLREHGIRHAVLGAFGCGAFGNPAEAVAAIYRDEIAARASSFSAIDFAILETRHGAGERHTFAAFARALMPA